MKTKAAVCVIVSLTSLFIVSLTPFFGSSAQSGRAVPKPAPVPAPDSPKQPEVKPEFVVDPNADKYKLVFPTGYEDNLLYKDPPKNGGERKQREKEREKDADRRMKAYRASFTEQLSQAGSQGYKIISTAGHGRLAIAKLDKVQYEYDLFDIGSNLFFAKDGFEEQYAELTNKGFLLIGHLSSSRSCENENTSYGEHGAVPQIFPPSCEYSDRFLVGREKGHEAPRQFTLARHAPRWRALKSDTPLTAQINDYLAIGFHPTHAFSKYEILLQPATDRDKLSIEMTEAQVVTGNEKKIRQKVNELAQQGYRLALTREEVAVMCRGSNTAPPLSYVWLFAPSKNFEQELARLQDKGAIFWMIHPDSDTNKFTLVFEQPTIGGGGRREYKVLGFELQETENVEQKRVNTDLTPASKENLKALNRLVKEGFEVRDLFDLSNASATKVGVLLERSR